MNDASSGKEIYLTFSGHIDDGTAHRICNLLGLANNNKIPKVSLILQTPGGNVGSGIAIYNFIRSLPMEIVAYNIGHVLSIGVIVFLAAGKRICTVNSSFMIHQTSLVPQSSMGANSMRAISESLSWDDANTEKILREHLCLSDEQWDTHSRRELYITPESALKCKLVHEIKPLVIPESSEIYAI